MAKESPKEYSKVGKIFLGYIHYTKNPNKNHESKNCEYDIENMVLDGGEILDGLNYLVNNISIRNQEEMLEEISELIKGKTGRFAEGLREILEE